MRAPGGNVTSITSTRAAVLGAETARRWLTLFPGPLGKRGEPPTEAAIQALCQDPERLATLRARLSDVSWFMRCVNEPIARRANREDECTGRFWEGRFKCQRLDDAGALLACMMYVDLNPVRAGIAATPETSDFSSGQDRSVACRARRELAAVPALPTPADDPLIAQARVEAERDRWLVPFADLGENPSDTGERAHGVVVDRSFDRPGDWLAGISSERYLELLDWTGRELRADKPGQISPELRPVLERLDLDVEAWIKNVGSYRSLFHRLVGKLDRMRAWARATGRLWLHGKRGARRLYAQAAQAAPQAA